MKYVIIGNGPAGTSCIGAIREVDSEGKITVISDESYLNYSRPLISYYLAKALDKDRMTYYQANFYRENRIEIILNKTAKKLDIKKKEVVLADKQKIPFDKLLIATGGEPIVPEIKGRDSYGVFTFIKWQDAEDISRYIEKNKTKEAVVLGGGLIGLKATEALMEREIKVTIVELADRILSSTFDRKASGIIEEALNKAGCQVITNNTITEIKSQTTHAKAWVPRVKSVILKNKKQIQCDLLIIAIGVTPNTELIKDTPIRVDRGIIVDNFMQTSQENIYAAGDCCEVKDLLLGKTCLIAIWPNATRQGKIAGYNMVGIRKEYQGSFAMNSIELCGIPTISIGITEPKEDGYEVIEHLEETKPVYRKLALKDNKIIGAIFIGEPIERAGIYTGLIKDRVDVRDFKEHLLKEDFGLISLPKEYRKHLVSGPGVEA